METDVVQAVLLDDPHDPFPLGIVERRVSRFRENGVLDRTPQVDRTAVQQHMVAALSHLAQAEHSRFFMLAGSSAGGRRQPARHRIEIRIEFVPQFRIPPQRNAFRQVCRLPVAAHGHFPGQFEPVPRDGEQRLAFERLPGMVGDRHPHLDAPVRNARVKLHVLDEDRVHGHQFHFAENAVPVDLRELRMGVVPLVGIVLEAVVDAHRDTVRLSRSDEIGQVVVVRNADIVDAAHLLGVHPHRTEPVSTFEIEEDALALPVGGKLDVALVPRRTHIFVDTRQAIDIPVGRFIPDLVVVGDAGKRDRLLKFMVVPGRKRSSAEIHHVRLEPPLSRKVHFAGLRGRRRESFQEHDGKEQF